MTILWTGDEAEVYTERSLVRGAVTVVSHVFLDQLARVRAVRLQLAQFIAETPAPLSGETGGTTPDAEHRPHLVLER